jgi:NTE family protein
MRYSRVDSYGFVPQPGVPCMRGIDRRAWMRGAGVLAAGALAGCDLAGGVDHTSTDAPHAAPLAASGAAPRPRRTAWVFGSGGPRGFVHVGVLKALEDLGLVPDLIVGTSVGALVGTLRAAGADARRIERMALDVQPWQLLRWQPRGEARWSGSPIAEFVNDELANRPLQALQTPMVCAVQRLRDGEVLGFTHGDAGLAVQAAVAIEGQFAPLTIRGERYGDADLRMPLPVRLARRVGATHVLAVDASAREDGAPPGAERYRASDLHKRALTRPDALRADVLLHPEIGYWVGVSRAWREGAIEAGYRSALGEADRLRALHG